MPNKDEFSFFEHGVQTFTHLSVLHKVAKYMEYSSYHIISFATMCIEKYVLNLLDI